ncbi:MAG TPA: ABC transporter permease [Anaerolineae bacterium]|nr:ABC transporter permease [Anaerolineae bacterium]
MIDRVLNLVRKEILQISRDRVLVAFILLVPVLQLSLLAQATSQGVRERPLAVVDGDHTSYSRRLVDALENTETLSVCCALPDASDVQLAIRRGNAELALIIPPGFADKLLSTDDTARVELIADGSNNIVAVNALGAAQGAIARFASDVFAKYSATAGAAPVELRTSIRYNPELNARYYTMPAQVGFIVYQVTLAVAAVSLAREREVGTLEQLIIAPIRRPEIILGKAITPLLVASVDFGLLLAVAILVFDVPMRGSLTLLAPLTLLFIIAETAWGLMISTIARTQQQAVLFVFVQAMLDMTFSGYLVPVDNLPWLLRAISNVVPMRHYLVVIRSIMLKGATVGMLWPQVLSLAGLGVAIATLAALNVSRRLD